MLGASLPQEGAAAPCQKDNPHEAYSKGHHCSCGCLHEGEATRVQLNTRPATHTTVQWKATFKPLLKDGT